MEDVSSVYSDTSDQLRAAAMDIYSGIPNWALKVGMASVPVGLFFGGACYRMSSFTTTEKAELAKMGERGAAEYANIYVGYSMMVPNNDIRARRVDRVMGTLLAGNPDVNAWFKKSKVRGSWRFNVIDEAVCSSISFPSGHVFVHQGLLSTVSSDDELAFALAHEMAVVMLCHMEKQANHKSWWSQRLAHLMEPLTWSEASAKRLSDFFLSWSDTDIIEMQKQVPMDPALVYEADVEAFKYMTMAGYDPRAAEALLFKFYLQEKLDVFWKSNQVMGDIQRNPAADSVIKNLSVYIPDWRRKCCSKARWDMFSDRWFRMEQVRKSRALAFSDNDPRKDFAALAKAVNDYTGMTSDFLTLWQGEKKEEIPRLEGIRPEVTRRSRVRRKKSGKVDTAEETSPNTDEKTKSGKTDERGKEQKSKRVKSEEWSPYKVEMKRSKSRDSSPYRSEPGKTSAESSAKSFVNGKGDDQSWLAELSTALPLHDPKHLNKSSHNAASVQLVTKPPLPSSDLTKPPLPSSDVIKPPLPSCDVTKPPLPSSDVIKPPLPNNDVSKPAKCDVIKPPSAGVTKSPNGDIKLSTRPGSVVKQESAPPQSNHRVSRTHLH